jgi:hypothetical protein
VVVQRLGQVGHGGRSRSDNNWMWELRWWWWQWSVTVPCPRRCPLPGASSITTRSLSRSRRLGLYPLQPTDLSLQKEAGRVSEGCMGEPGVHRWGVGDGGGVCEGDGGRLVGRQGEGVRVNGQPAGTGAGPRVHKPHRDCTTEGALCSTHVVPTRGSTGAGGPMEVPAWVGAEVVGEGALLAHGRCTVGSNQATK